MKSISRVVDFKICQWQQPVACSLQPNAIYLSGFINNQIGKLC